MASHLALCCAWKTSTSGVLVSFSLLMADIAHVPVVDRWSAHISVPMGTDNLHLLLSHAYLALKWSLYTCFAYWTVIFLRNTMVSGLKSSLLEDRATQPNNQKLKKQSVSSLNLARNSKGKIPFTEQNMNISSPWQ